MRENVEGPWVSSQDEEDGAYRVRLLVDELSNDYADDRCAIQAALAGLVDFAIAQQVPPWMLAEEFLINLRAWIKDRDRQEAETMVAILKASREGKP